MLAFAKKIDPRIRHFGLLSSFFLFTLALYLIFKNQIIASFFLVILGCTFLVISIVAPKFLSGITKLWLKFGDVLGRIISPITLGLIFYTLIMPTGILTRLFGRDELLLKKKDKKSYWLTRSKSHGKSVFFERQF
jgi:Saxitoxin biosynthesis operon protein SxtJ